MRNTKLGALVASLALTLGLAGTAEAAPTEVDVRIEGLNGTIFDHTLTVDGRTVQAASDSQPRTCDGTNNGANPTPGPTPTSASVDAMDLLGSDFDADWYDGYDDYFISRWADESQDGGQGFYWGVLINGAFTPVGGCQAQLAAGDESLWANDAFSGRPFLRLDGPETVTVDEAASYDVISNSGDGLTGTAYEGATVDGITGAAKPVPDAVIDEADSNASGTASVTFNEPGWHRLKATDPSDGAVDDAVPSNSIEVCVEETAGEGCDGQPLGERPFSLVPVNDAAPKVSGHPTAGEQLSADEGEWTEYPTGYEYEWQRCDETGANCQAIAGATGATYTLTGEDVGSTVRVAVTAQNEEGNSEPATSGPTDTVARGGYGEPADVALKSLRHAAGRRVVVGLTSSAAGRLTIGSPRFQGAPRSSRIDSGRSRVSARLDKKAAKALRKRGRIRVFVRAVVTPSGDAAKGRDTRRFRLRR